MTDRTRRGAEPIDADPLDSDQAPELHNSEQDDEAEQTQTVAEDALHGEARQASPLDSTKADNPGEIKDDSTQDLIDHMRDMEQSGRIDMGAYRGEPNMDDEAGKYGEANKLAEDRRRPR